MGHFTLALMMFERSGAYMGEVKGWPSETDVVSIFTEVGH